MLTCVGYWTVGTRFSIYFKRSGRVIVQCIAKTSFRTHGPREQPIKWNSTVAVLSAAYWTQKAGQEGGEIVLFQFSSNNISND